MLLSKLFNNLEKELYEACVRYIPLLIKDVKDESIYAFTIQIESGFISMDIACNTVEALATKINKEKAGDNFELISPDIYLEMNSAEWEYSNMHWELFSSVDKVLDTFFSRLYEGEGFDDLDKTLSIEQVMNVSQKRIIKIIINVLQRLKNEKLFDSNSFEEDLFLGVQFSEIGKEEIILIEKVSNKLNSEYWFEKITEIKEYIKVVSE